MNEPQTPDEHAALRELFNKRRRAWAKSIGFPMPRWPRDRRPEPGIIDHEEPEG
jgi:hypothetical protein